MRQFLKNVLTCYVKNNYKTSENFSNRSMLCIIIRIRYKASYSKVANPNQRFGFIKNTIFETASNNYKFILYDAVFRVRRKIKYTIPDDKIRNISAGIGESLCAVKSDGVGITDPS
jgi:hypothetical protein